MTRSMQKKPADASADPHNVAAQWMVKAEYGRLSQADEERLDAWLDADPAHAQAWEDVHAATDLAIRNAADERIKARRAEALALRPERSGWPALFLAASLGVVLLGGGLVAFQVQGGGVAPEVSVSTRSPSADPKSALYRTAIGERSTIALPDGSFVTLDTNSLLRVAYTGRERGVRLLRGQALFDVAKHRTPVFRVYAADRMITAVGTKFNVRLSGEGDGSAVKVTLLEGVVKVRPRPAFGMPLSDKGEVTMAAGELLDAERAAPVRVTAADLEREASWRSGIVVFIDEPMTSAVAEMNRYTARPIVIADGGVASRRISGAFRTGDPERFAEMIAEVFPIEVDHSAEGAPVLKSKR
jgi:transmembrane sensor